MRFRETTGGGAMSSPSMAIARTDAEAYARRRRVARLREAILSYGLVLPVFAFLVVLIVIPALSVIRDSIFVPQAHGGRILTLSLYQSIFSDPISRHDIVFTLVVTVVTIAILLPLCYAIALYVHFSRSWMVGWYRVLCIVPLFIPTIISAFAFIVFFQSQGVLDTLLRTLGIEQFLHLTYFEPINDNLGVGIILGSIWNSIPFTVLLLGAGLSEIDNALIEAARDVGAGNWSIFWRLIIPLTRQQVLVALTLDFLGVLGSFTIPYLLGPTAPMMMGPLLNATYNDYREPLLAGAQAVILFLMAALVGVTYVITVAHQTRGVVDAASVGMTGT